MPGVPVRILGWRLGHQLFGVNVRNVVHIVERVRVRAVPRPLPGVSGLTFYRGLMVPVLDLARVLLDELHHRWPEDARHLILQADPVGGANWGASTANPLCAAKVDSVLRMFTLNTDELATWRKPPDQPAAPFVRAQLERDEGTLWLIDVRRIIRSVHQRFPLRRDPALPHTRQGA